MLIAIASPARLSGSLSSSFGETFRRALYEHMVSAWMCLRKSRHQRRCETFDCRLEQSQGTPGSAATCTHLHSEFGLQLEHLLAAEQQQQLAL